MQRPLAVRTVLVLLAPIILAMSACSTPAKNVTGDAVVTDVTDVGVEDSSDEDLALDVAPEIDDPGIDDVGIGDPVEEPDADDPDVDEDPDADDPGIELECRVDDDCDDGGPCEQGRCQDGSCILVALDEDSDGYGAISDGGMDCGGDDCCDSDPLIHPGATFWYSDPHTCGGAATFDYDCDGIEERLWTSEYACNTSAIYCFTISAGWRLPVPECGQSATYCTGCGPDPYYPLCNSSCTTSTQMCR